MENLTTKVKVKVSGNIVSELSEKIPSNIIALNELIKNAYDAGANNVVIDIDEQRNELIISDDGSGMTRADIDTLFHISQSTKKYGQLVNGRYVQGSKGLGFLSAFKFGRRKVRWLTYCNEGLDFSANYNDIIKESDISNYEIVINNTNEISKGTKIIIELDEFNKTSLLSYLRDEKNHSKILHTFTDDSFNISLKLDGIEHFSNTLTNIENTYTEKQLYIVEYDSEKQVIEYYFNKRKIDSIPYVFTSTEYSLKIKLGIYQLFGGGKKNISKLFFDKKDDLTPLVYVNNNLFENYDLFDPNIMQLIKKGDTLNQIIGYINIYSDNKLIEFNSDRTQFAQNTLTDEIRSFLSEINKKIQKEGSSRKNYLVSRDFLKTSYIDGNKYDLTNSATLRGFIREDFFYKDKVEISYSSNLIKFEVFGIQKEIQVNYPKPAPIVARIDLSKKEEKINIPSAQIQLINYVFHANNSKGEKLKDTEIDIFIDGQSCNGVLASIDVQCEKTITYKYNDVTTGQVVNELTLKFVAPTTTLDTSSGCTNKLITIPAQQKYRISFNPTIVRLIDEINELDFSKYFEVISCSLRSLFEISMKTIRKMNPSKFTFSSAGDIFNCIKETIAFASKTNNLTEIDNKTKIGYDTLKNLLDDKIANCYKTIGNLGAHTATEHVTENDAKDCAKKVAILLVIVNEIYNNPSIV